MPQHYRTTHYESDSICGTNIVGQRTPQDMNAELTDCIACKAILENRPLYSVTAIDEDGYTDRDVFNTLEEQMARMESAVENGAVNITLRIIPVADLKNGEW